MGGSPRMAAACREHFSDLTCVMSSRTSGRSCNEPETPASRAGDAAAPGDSDSQHFSHAREQ